MRLNGHTVPSFGVNINISPTAFSHEQPKGHNYSTVDRTAPLGQSSMFRPNDRLPTIFELTRTDIGTKSSSFRGGWSK